MYPSFGTPVLEDSCGDCTSEHFLSLNLSQRHFTKWSNVQLVEINSFAHTEAPLVFSACKIEKTYT